MALIIRNYVATERIICRACPDTIEPGQVGLVFLYDGNEAGTGPSEHRAHHPGVRPRSGLVRKWTCSFFRDGRQCSHRECAEKGIR